MNKYTVTIYVQGQGWEVSESVETFARAVNLARSIRRDFGQTKNTCDIAKAGTGEVIARWRLLDGEWTAVVPD